MDKRYRSGLIASNFLIAGDQRQPLAMDTAVDNGFLFVHRDSDRSESLQMYEHLDISARTSLTYFETVLSTRLN